MTTTRRETIEDRMGDDPAFAGACQQMVNVGLDWVNRPFASDAEAREVLVSSVLPIWRQVWDSAEGAGISVRKITPEVTEKIIGKFMAWRNGEVHFPIQDRWGC